MKIKLPMTTDPIEATKTAAAATSLAIFAFSWICGLTRSTIASIEVFMSSRIRTKVIMIAISNHSVTDIFSVIPRIVARIAKII